MRIEASVSAANITPTVTVEHNGQHLTFSISFYRRTIFDKGFPVFSQINAYWADQTPQVQQAIFDIYHRIHESFNDIGVGKEALQAYLQNQIIDLFSYHNLELVQEWIGLKALDVQLPESISSEFIADVDRNTSIGKTYIASDYRRLAALAMVLRCMIPIWGEYIANIKAEVEDSFKEMMAFQIVDKVLTQNVPAIRKLTDYIQNTINSANLSRPMGVFKGISTSDYPRWLLSLVCIRCLAVGDIRGINKDAHLVTFIHVFITNRLNSKDDLDDSKIKEKEIDETMGDDGARASALERYKIKANIAIGDVVELEYFLSDFGRVANQLAPGISFDDVARGIEHMRDYEGRPTDPQIRLLRWVLSPVVPQKIVLYLPEELVKSLMGVMEAVLWKRNHRYLSVLSTCHPIISEKEMVVSPVDSKMRIPEPLAEQLDVLFPYKRNQRNKKVGAKESNLAMESIDILTNDIFMFGWRPSVHPERVEEVLGYRTSRFSMKPDIKTDIARLVIEIQTRSYLNQQPQI